MEADAPEPSLDQQAVEDAALEVGLPDRAPVLVAEDPLRDVAPALSEGFLLPRHTEAAELLREAEGHVDAPELPALRPLDPPAVLQAPAHLEEAVLEVEVAPLKAAELTEAEPLRRAQRNKA
jgi:hypothetical protein